MADNLVGYSRAGDAFHYRWAARRSLKLIYPNSPLYKIVVEGSADKNKAGEYIIDLTEYYGEETAPIKIIYYQLKHTTTQKNKPFLISGLKDTFEGFSKKFTERNKKKEIKILDIQFCIVTNRPLDQKLKDNLQDIAFGTCTDKRFLNTISSYTKLKPGELKLFCSILQIEDSHSGYDLQQEELRIEMLQLTAGCLDNSQLHSLVSTVSGKVLPNSDGVLRREDVLNSFGIYSDRDLYPAEPIWEPAGPVIKRKQHLDLTDQIFAAKYPLIIHAPGGVGKSVFTRQLLENIEEGSVAIAYDCFGAGKYRNRSQSRHRHKDALVQIANELAAKGLCDPLLVFKTDDESSITQSFLKRIKTAVTGLRKAYPNAILLILIDAADNAEMAAKEMNDSCFAGELLKEEIPEGCKLVYLCRPERIDLLQPPAKIIPLALDPFLLEETIENLHLHFPDATSADGEEFHRLTSANPRVQANALATVAGNVEELLAGLGPNVITVEAQIQKQLENALEKLKDNLTTNFQGQVDKICMGLATLSPNIPLEILAKVAGIDTATVRSFVSDIGRALWQSDESVQFRDEPTETWFRGKFLASKKDFENYILELEPLARHSSYTAQVLPQLYLQAEQYHKLIDIALSDAFLPEDNPIDARNIRVYRLQFALKAALRINQHKDACMLALRAGEEVAGNERQMSLLKENIDLLVRLQNKEKVQSMAMRRELRGAWEGSENVFSASLLSSVEAFKGEARGFLRSAENWLDIYFKTPKERDPYQQENLQDSDLLEIAYSKLNLNGIADCMKFLTRLKPKAVIAKIFGGLIRRLIDLGDEENIDGLLQECKKEPLFVIQLNSELFDVGRFCKKEFIEEVFEKVVKGKLKIEKIKEHSGDKPKESTLALAEAAIYHGITAKKLISFAEENLVLKPDQLITSSRFTLERDYFLRSIALHNYAQGTADIDISSLFPLQKSGKKVDYDEQRKIDDAKEVIGGLLPWYTARIELIANSGSISEERLDELAKKSQKAVSGRYRFDDPVPNTVAIVYLDILKLANGSETKFIASFFEKYIKENKSISIDNWISTVRWTHRLDHLTWLRDQLEEETYKLIKDRKGSGPDVLSDYYVTLARAVINTSTDNASVYFDDAVEIVSKFGEEMLRRWEALVPLAKRTAELIENKPELSYRFSRISELVGQDTREKHWDREGALQISARISPSDGIAALSRWREREIGDFGQMIYCMLAELVNSANLNPLEAWAFTEFCPADDLQYALRMFLKSPAISNVDKKTITESALHRLERESISEHYCRELQELISLQGFSSAKLKKILEQFPKDSEKKQTEFNSFNEGFMPEIDWNMVFNSHDLLSPEGITSAHKVLQKYAEENNIHLPRHVYWKALITRLKSTDLANFLFNLLQCSWVEVYDIGSLLDNLPKAWTERIAFQRKQESVVEAIGVRYALELTSDYTFRPMIKSLPGPEDKTKWLLQGIFKGLMNMQEFATAENLFELVQRAAPGLSPVEAAETLDYAMSRFELHIEVDLGDGPWSKWLQMDLDTTKAMAMFLWSALGSPVSATRWRAVHTVKKLAEFGKQGLIDAIFGCSDQKETGAFGCNRYPFYDLHALQYLLIASARIALEFPVMITRHSAYFYKYAVNFEHAVIQRFAAETALRIEAAIVGTYTSTELDALKKTIKPDQVLPTKNLQEIPDSPKEEFDINGYEEDADEESETAQGFNFGYDFSRYWLEDLGDVFGFSQKYMVDVTGGLVTNEWGQHANAYNDDPRLELWNSSHNYYRTSHDHGRYPRDDNFSFYLSYHAMMTVAGRLIKKEPLSTENYSEGNSWEEWLKGHLNTRADGYWLSDWRDPLPMKRPDIAELDISSWQSDIQREDFLNCLYNSQDGKLWLNVEGTWQETIDYKKENYQISSAFVSPETANALMRALETCSDPHDYKLPEYDEDDMEIDKPPFRLRGWIVKDNLSFRLDENDPYADELMLPPYYVGKEIENIFGLVSSAEGKVTYKNGGKIPVILSKHWSRSRPSRDEESEQKGMLMAGSLEFLREMCVKLEKEIILEVQIQRNYYSRHSSSSDKNYKPAIHKIFILSSDGTLRDTAGSYQVG